MVQHYRPLSGLSGTERLTHSIKNLIVSGLGEKYFTTFLQVISPLLPTKTRKIRKRDFQPLCRNSFLQPIKGTECQQNTAAALPTAPSETWLPWDFPLLIIDELKSWILTKAYRTSLLACAFCVQCLQLTAKLCDPISRCCLQPSICSQALHSTYYQSSLLFSFIGNFLQGKNNYSALQTAFRHPSGCVFVCSRVLVPQIKTGIWLKHKLYRQGA